MPSTLTAADYQRAADALGCDVEIVRAVTMIESAGAGFLKDGRCKILFEAHHFDRLTSGLYRVDHPSISSRSWNRALYAKTGAGEWVRFAEAAALDRDAAAKATSWGLFQIMGFNHAMVGFDDVQGFVAAMMTGEAAQLDAFVAFIRATHLADELVREDWAAFARGYNGPGYHANAYDTRLAAEFARGRALAGGAAKHKADTIAVQAALTVKGANLATDGNHGPLTETALEQFQADTGLPKTGLVTPETRAALGIEKPSGAFGDFIRSDAGKMAGGTALTTAASSIFQNPWVTALVILLGTLAAAYWLIIRPRQTKAAGR